MFLSFQRILIAVFLLLHFYYIPFSFSSLFNSHFSLFLSHTNTLSLLLFLFSKIPLNFTPYYVSQTKMQFNQISLILFKMFLLYSKINISIFPKKNIASQMMPETIISCIFHKKKYFCWHRPLISFELRTDNLVNMKFRYIVNCLKNNTKKGRRNFAVSPILYDKF